MLRDKLHITTAQLAEVTGHVRELEAEKREVWERMLPSVPENLESEKLREALATLGIFVVDYSPYKLIPRQKNEKKSRLQRFLVFRNMGLFCLVDRQSLRPSLRF